MLKYRTSLICTVLLLASGAGNLPALAESAQSGSGSSVAVPKLSDVPKEKVEYLRKLFDATGVEQNVSSNIDGICMVLSANLRRSLYDQLHKENSDTEACNKTAAEQTDQIMETFKKRLDIHTELFTIMASIYDKYFSTDELKSMWAFYESPVGKKFTTKLPEMSKESQQTLLDRVRTKIDAAMFKEKMHAELKNDDTKAAENTKVAETPNDDKSGDTKSGDTKSGDAKSGDTNSGAEKKGEKPSKESLIEQRKHALIKRCLDSSGLKDGLRSFVTKQLDGVLEVARKSINASTFSETEKSKRLERITTLQTVFQKDVDMTEAICEITEELLDKHFSEKELEETVKYYESSIGKKAVALMPKITEESRELGRVLLGPKIDTALTQSIKDVTDKKLMNDPRKPETSTDKKDASAADARDTSAANTKDSSTADSKDSSAETKETSKESKGAN